MSRFLICSLIMKSYENDVFINDIDFSPNYKLDLIGQILKNKNLMLVFMMKIKSLPWTKFAAGCCYFDTKVNFQIVF